jgi:glutamate transport system permease protein
VAAAFGLLEATARMDYFLNRGANERVQIFLLFALGYIIIVEVVSAGSAVLERRFRVAR